MFRKFSFKRYFLSWIVFFGVIYLFFILGSKKIFASIDGEPNCHLWTVSEIDSNGNMELKDYKSDGTDLKSIVVPNAADFKATNPTKYANLKKVYVKYNYDDYFNSCIYKSSVYSSYQQGTFQISQTKGSNPDEGKVFVGDPAQTATCSLWQMFGRMPQGNIKFINLSNLDVSNVDNMSNMFWGSNNFETINLNSWNTTNVIDMGNMFKDSSELKDLDLGESFVTSKVANMQKMFYGCSSLENLNLNSWDTSNVGNKYKDWNNLEVNGDMREMFYGCSSLKTLDLNNWNTANVPDMSSMFENCTSLKKLDVSNWNIANTNMYHMFYKCPNLRYLDLNGWNLNESNQSLSQLFYVNEKTSLLIRTRDNVLKNYNYNGDNRTFFTTTLKVDGDFAKFKIDSDEENVSYSDNGKEKYIIIYPTYTTTDSEEEIINKLKNRLIEERDKIEFKNGQKSDWVPAENYKSVDDALGGTYMIGAEKYSATLKVDGKIAKFKENDNSFEPGNYNSDRTEKYVNIYVIPEEGTDKKIVWTKLKQILEDEKENIEIDKNYAFVKWNPDIDETQEPNQSLGTYSVKTKGYLIEDANFSWPQLKSGINVGESISIKDLFCITDSPNIPAGCKLIYKIGDGEGTYWVEYAPNDKLVFDKSGELKIYLKIDGGDNYFDKEYEKNGLNYKILSVNEKYSATLKVDGEIAKFKENSPGQYSPDRTEKYIDIYCAPTGSNNKKIVWQELKRILEAEKENVEVDSSHGLVKWNPDINENQEPNKSLGTYFINTKGYLVEGTDFSWPELKSDIDVGESISIKDLFCITDSPNIPAGCKLIYKIGDGEGTYWVEYAPNDKRVFDQSGELKIYLKIDGGESYFDKEYEKNGLNYKILSVNEKKYSATLKVDGEIAKFKENSPGQYSPDRTEKYIDIYFTPTGSNDKKIVWQELKRILEAEKENVEVDSSHGLVKWNPDINENQEPNKSLGTYFINTKGYLVEGTDFSWPELKSDIKIGELISVKDFFGIKSVPKVPQGCKLIYKIGDENSSGWKEYLATDTVLFEKAIDYKIYLKIDGGENYFDREYEKNGRNYLILRIGNKDKKDDESDEGTGIFHWDTISDGKVSLKSIGLPSRLKTEKYLDGYSDGTIKPNNNVKRGEFANMIYKLMHDDKEKVNTDVLKNLNDVKSSDWYGASVAYVLDKKIFDTGKNFRPNENVTRGEVAEVIYNVIKFYDSTKTKEYSPGKYYYNFTDLSGPVSDIIKQLASHGIVNGYEDKTFKQNNNITRAEVTKIIFTAFNRKSNPGKKKYSDLDNKHWAYKYLMDASE